MKMLVTILPALLILIAAELASAQSKDGGGGSSLFRQASTRAANRESKRWTLQEWLEQRDRNRMMDLWLAMNSPSPYELMFSAQYNSYANTSAGVEQKYTSYSGHISAFAEIIGLSAEYENNTQEKYTDTTGIFNLRIFGNSIQSSNITLHYGLQTRVRQDLSPEIRLSQQFAQVSIQLYMTRYFGIDGNYRQYQPTTDPSLGEISGQKSTANIFIDFGAFRIFGGGFSEVEKINLNNTMSEKQKTGSQAGFKFFF